MSDRLQAFELPPAWVRLLKTPLSDLFRGQITGALHWQVDLAQADLPDEAKAAIQSTVKQTKLWQRERRDVTHDLIAHFEDAIEAGATPNEAIEAFGDTKTAAKLIRRAKRRCRPLWWQAWWWASRSAATLAGVYLLMAIWLGSVKPTITTDYVAKLNASAEAVREEDRAWPLYYQALRPLYDEMRADLKASQGRSGGGVWGWEPRWEDRTEAETDAWLVEHQLFLEQIREAAARPHLGATVGRGGQAEADYARLEGKPIRGPSDDPFDDNFYSILLPHCQEMRSLARVLREDTRRAAREGDNDRSADNLVAMLGVGKHAGQGGHFLVAGLVRVACEGIARETLLELMTDHPGLFATDDLVRLAHAFAAIEYPPDRWLDGERLGFRDFIQRTYSDDGHGDGFLTASGVRELRQWSTSLGGDPVAAAEHLLPGLLEAATPAFYLAAASRKEVLAAYDRFYAACLVDATTPLWRWEHRSGMAEHFFHANFTSTDQQLRYYPIMLLAPAVTAASQAFHRSLGLRDGVLIGLALELHRRDQGHYPPDSEKRGLDKLSPRWLPKLPVDPINGGPLGYRLVDGKPVVYSLGIDRDDDGGRLPAYMNDAENEEEGYSTTQSYRVRPPLTDKELAEPPRRFHNQHNGDWVLWSLGEPRYAPRAE